MWSRDVEIMLGCWLLISPLVFAHPPDQLALWITDLSAGGAVIACGLLSYWHPTRRAHLLTLVTGCCLIACAYRHFGSLPPAAQNEAVLGFLLVMFAIIPNRASCPSPSWEARRKAGSGGPDPG